MTAELTSIKTAFEEEGMSPEEIADSQSLDIAAVKAGLMQCSSTYRKMCGKEDCAADTLNFDEDENRRIKEAIVELALGAQDESVRLKAAIYVRDDFKGRKDVVKGMAGQNFNILFVNEQLKKVRGIADGIRNAIPQVQKVIDA